MHHSIIGTTLPAIEFHLGAGESVIADSGELSWMTDSIGLRTTVAGGGAKGLFGAVKRAMGGGTLFLTEFKANGAPGSVTFATKMPGQILPITLEPGTGYKVHRHGFLAGTPGIEVTADLQKGIRAGLFGGEGFVLQWLRGQAQAWVGLAGEVVIKDLQPGESMRVHPGHVGMFEERVHFTIELLPGVANKLFGGDGLFVARLQGPGRIWLQTLPLPNLAHALLPYLPSGEK